ncbi:RTA1 like protein-domain-containing protein [Lactifluus volemus]|nr:RTA1 like protein-domain-containing protein [Lactifluus volemus]
MSTSTLLSTLERLINSVGGHGNQLDYVLWYNYIPSEWASITFLVLFGLSTFLCGFLELMAGVLDYGRAKMPRVTTLVVAPTLLVAANFILLGRVIRRLGPQYSRLTPKLYAIVFLSVWGSSYRSKDVVSLVVQGIGGTTVSVAKTLKEANLSACTLDVLLILQLTQCTVYQGSHITLGGVLFQLVTITTYCALATEFLIRYARERPIRHVPAGFIFLRTIYRTAEFLDGFQGTIASTQPLFVIFDGAMITLAMVTLNIFHPGDLLQNPQSDYYHDSDPTSSKKFNDSVNPAVMRTV